MCGIVGIFSKDKIDVNLLMGMTGELSHRGPDDVGYVVIDTQKGVTSAFRDAISRTKGYNLGFGHRRLSIIDLSENAHQPMSVEQDRFWIVHNGEVYNYLEIRDELVAKGYKFISKSDTEVILCAYVEWGEKCVEKLNGMFSFVIWDGDKRRIFGARDRFGIKPFYYYIDEDRFIFASEIKAILKANDIRYTPNDSIIYDYLVMGLHDHEEETFFKGINQLLPGYYFTLSTDLTMRIFKYWELEEKNHILANFYEDFRFQFERAIKIRLRSDVRVGSCLSGGLDSSSIVCMVDKLGKNGSASSVGSKIETFSSCFSDPLYDEREYIEEVANRTHSIKNYVFPKVDDFWEEIHALIRQQDEPFGSASVYAQWCLMRKAKEKGVKVLLDGQGGDEILAGYRKFLYFNLMLLLQNGNIPGLLKESMSIFLRHDKELFNLNDAKRYFPKFMRKAVPNIIDILEPSFRADFKEEKINIRALRTLAQRQILDLRVYSIPALVRYEDRNSMAFSIETRLPFLDFELAERVVNYPPEYKIRSGVTKHVMRVALKDILPPKVRQRRSKLGFVTPQKKWMKGYLKDKITDITHDHSVSSRYIDFKRVKGEWQSFCQGKTSISDRELFRVIILVLWMREFKL
ncbi:MAG: asparagine synthase (glutamine-hydrolyzing) [Promethearchaeota archaeon]